MAGVFDKPGSRYDTNRRVKMVLVRHGVNLALLQWSSSSSTTYFYGVLKKEPDDDFSLTALDALIKDLVHMSHAPRIRFNLENWDISSETGSWVITKKKPVKTAAPAAEKSRTVVIRTNEKPEDVLRDMEKEKHSGGRRRNKT